MQRFQRLHIPRGRPKGSTTFNPVIAQALGDTTRELRVERGISQEALAGMAGIERSHLGKIERGEHVPSLTALWKLACVLDISASQLLAAVERKLPRQFDPRP